jgi:hypothetical protein
LLGITIQGKKYILSDEKRLWDLALVCDISHHLNYLNTKRQGQQKLISDMFGAVKRFSDEAGTILETVGKC